MIPFNNFDFFLYVYNCSNCIHCLTDLSNYTNFQHSRKYKTLDTRHSGRANNSSHLTEIGNTNSLERGMLRRKLPDLPQSQMMMMTSTSSSSQMPTRSLPRPAKRPMREQSDSRSRERVEQQQQKRSQSHGDELQVIWKNNLFLKLNSLRIFLKLINCRKDFFRTALIYF